MTHYYLVFFFFQAEDGIRDYKVTGVQTCALPVAHLLAVDGLHADDADDDFGRHAVLLFGTRQRGGIVLPETGSGAYAHGLDKAAAVDAPVLGRALDRKSVV